MKQKLFLLVGLFALLAGCTMAPEYTRPEAPVPSSWPSGSAYKDTQATAGAPLATDLGWREFFADERLQRIIETALDNNRDLRVASLTVERARALYRIQRNELFPAVNAVGSGGKERVPADLSITGSSYTAEQYRVNLGISSWEIDFFGRIRSLEKRALEEYFSTEEARRSARILLVSEVASAYLTLAADREILKLAQSTLETQRAAYDLIRLRYEKGLATALDLRQAQTQVEAARVDIARYIQRVALDENALNLLVGLPVSGDLLPEALNTVIPPKEISPGTSSEVLFHRPDILSAENLLKAANANIGAARAALFPRITLTTAFGTASDELSGLFKAGSASWNFSSQIVLPIFDARAWAALEATKVEREIAVAQYEKAIQAAFREVADALAQRGTVGDQMEAQQSLVNATAETYRLANLRYTKGIDSYLAVLDAQRSLYSSQTGFIAIRLANYANQVRLFAVLGGGKE
jgi:multidrug efflux system outer membrane protein